MQVYRCVHLSLTSIGCSTTRGRLLHRLADAHDGHRRRALMKSPGAAPGAVPSYTSLFGASLSESALCKAREAACYSLQYSILKRDATYHGRIFEKNCRTGKQVGIRSSVSASFLQIVSDASLNMIAGMIQARTQDPFPHNQKPRKSLGSYPFRDIQLLM